MGNTSYHSDFGQATLGPSDADLRLLDDRMFEIEAVVTALLPEFEQVEAETRDGQSLAITEFTEGVSWSALRVGQRLSCRVRGVLTPEVVSASVLA